MMGPTHSATGLLAGLATLPVAPVSSAGQSAAWVAAWGGAALLPDLDTGTSTAAKLWGPLTRALGRVIGALAGGHRKGTHDLGVAPFLFAAIAWAAQLNTTAAGVVFAVMIGLSLIALDPILPGSQKAWLGNFVVSVSAAAALVAADVRLPWIPIAVIGGCVVHVLGDALTKGGIPVPFTTLPGMKFRTWGLGWFRSGYRVRVAGSDSYVPGLELVVVGGVWLTIAALTVHLAGDMVPELPRMVQEITSGGSGALVELLKSPDWGGYGASIQ